MSPTRQSLNASKYLCGLAIGVVIAGVFWCAGFALGVANGIAHAAPSKALQMASTPQCVDVYSERARKAYALPACKAGEL